MILKGLFILLFAMAFLISGGFLIAGLVKGKLNMWISSLVIAVFSILGIGYITLKGFTDSVAYVREGGLAEDTTEALVENVSKILETLARELDITPFEAMARKAGAIVAGSVKAAAGGMDGKLGVTPVFKSKELDDLGISIGRANVNLRGRPKTVGIFIEFTKPFKGTLRLTAYDSQEQKMDVAEIEVKEAVVGQQIKTFQFTYRSPGITGFSVLSAYPN